METLTMRPLRLTTLFKVLKTIDEYENVNQKTPSVDDIRKKLKSGRGISEMRENRMSEIVTEFGRLKLIDVKKINDSKVLQLSEIGKKLIACYDKNDANGIHEILYLNCKPYKYIVDIIKEYGQLKIFRYLFSWDDIPGNDSDRLMRFLREDFHIGWAKNAEIQKSADGKTIHIFKGKDQTDIMLEKKKATLTIGDDKTYLKVKKRDDKLHIYISDLAEKLKEKFKVKITSTVIDNCLQWGEILGVFQFFIGNGDEKIVYNVRENKVSYPTFVKSLEKNYFKIVKQKGDRLIELNRLRELTCRELEISRELFRENMEKYYNECPQKISLYGAPPSLDIGGDFKSKIKSLHERVDYQEGINISGVKRKYIKIEVK